MGADALVAMLVLAATLVQLAHGGMMIHPAEPAGLDLTSAVLAFCSAAPLAVARRSPLVVFGVAGAGSALLAGLGYPLDMAFAPAVALYYVPVHHGGPGRCALLTPVAVLGVFALYLGAFAFGHGEFPSSALLHTGLAGGGAWFAGERSRLRREQLEQFRERAHRAEREAERERLLAVAQERTRIARDLHDSVGHTITVIAVRAGGARLRRGTDPEAAWRALAAIEESARATAGEIDQIVRSLREVSETGVPPEAPVGLAALDMLVDRYADAGLAVTVVRGGPQRPLLPVADQAAYRILQEALTNAVRHGRGTATVRLDFADHALQMVIDNPVAGEGTCRGEEGHGLLGMRERATLIGGSVDVTRGDGWYRVRVRLPYGAQHS
jgi:signal transduction histidine kinase